MQMVYKSFFIVLYETTENILLDQDGKKEVTLEISVQSSGDNENYCYEGMKNLIRIVFS